MNPRSPADSNVRPSIWALALPSILSNLSYTIIGIAQTKVAGTLGADALAAVSAAGRIFYLMQGMMIAISVGTTALVARAWGANQADEANRATMASLVLCIGLSLPATGLAWWFANPMAQAFGLNPIATALAADQIRWLSPFYLAFAVLAILSAALRATGNAWTPLWYSIGINLSSIGLMVVLVFGVGGWAGLGLNGLPLASGLAFSAGALLLWLLWLSRRTVLTGDTRQWQNRGRLRNLISIGGPAGAEQLVIHASFIAFMMMMGNSFGRTAVAAYGVGANVLMVAITIGFGFGIASATLVGQHLGANDEAGANRAGWRCMAYAIAAMGAIALVTALLAQPLVGFFVADPDTQELAVWFVHLLATMMPLMAIDFALGGALRGAGDTRFPLSATLFSLVLARLGLATLALTLELSVYWFYASLVGDYVAKAVLLIWRYRQGRWRQRLKIGE